MPNNSNRDGFSMEFDKFYCYSCHDVTYQTLTSRSRLL